MIEDLLRDTLNDDRWTLAADPAAMDRLRHAHAKHRRRTAGAAAVGSLALVGAAVAGVSLLPSHEVQLATFAAGGVPAGSPAPGISPAWVPSTGDDWLLTTPQDDAFWTAHARPSSAPGQSVVASPAPLGPQSATLLADVQAAGLPVGTDLRREDAAGGQPNAPDVHITLPDGTPVEVERYWAQGPFPIDNHDGYDHSGVRVEDVPGTSTAGVAYQQFGFGFGPSYTHVTSHGVITVSRGGEVTMWAAPEPIQLETLKAWAFAAALHAGN
jgi:hypothetical protein